jgi:hypothetical protein
MANGLQSLTTRLPNGLTNAAPWQTLGDSGQLDPSWAYTYFDDFFSLFAAEWVFNGTGTPVLGQLNAEGGMIKITTTAAAGDTAVLQKTPTCFKIATTGNGKATYFKTQILTDANNGLFNVGLIGTTPVTPIDGMFFTKADSSNQINFGMSIGGVLTTVLLPSTCIWSTGVYIELGFEVTAAGQVNIFYNPGTGANPPPTNMARGPVASFTPAAFPTALLAPTFFMRNLSAAAQNMNIDYVFASKDR